MKKRFWINWFVLVIFFNLRSLKSYGIESSIIEIGLVACSIYFSVIFLKFVQMISDFILITKIKKQLNDSFKETIKIISKENYQNFNEMMVELEEMIEQNVSFYTVQSKYFEIRKELYDDNIILEDDASQELKRVLDGLSSRMLKLKDKR